MDNHDNIFVKIIREIYLLNILIYLPYQILPNIWDVLRAILYGFGLIWQ